MLCELKVTNFAIIDNVHIHFRQGLNILSGETGAGKSILLKSLGLLMGDKTSAEMVRDNAESAFIEGSFDLTYRPDIRARLEEMGIETLESQMVVRRVVAKDKSRVYINGALSTLSGLRDVVSPLLELAGHAVPLIEMTGLHENRNLLSRSYHLDLLDQFAGTWKDRGEFAQRFQHFNELRSAIEQIRSDSRNRAQRLDFLIYQRDEIQAMGLRAGEEAEIENETRRLKHSARLVEFTTIAENLLYNDDDSVTGRLHYLIQRANELKSIDPSLTVKLEPLSQAKALIGDVNYELRDYLKSFDSDPARLEQLQARLSSLRLLQKKYGATAVEILEALAQIEAEIQSLENSDEQLSGKVKELAILETELATKARDLHNRRLAAAQSLEAGINSELKDLNMKGVVFFLSVQDAEALSSSGKTSVEFMSRSSRSDSPRSLAKFASGGELSRVLLAIKSVVGQVADSGHFPRTYLFDEVDAGVSGPTAEKVGRKLKGMAQGQQVICVTHLPQVASFGDVHFYIHKSPGAGRRTLHTEVAELKKKERVQEIARLISGEKITRTSIAHAEQLLSESSH